MQTAYDELELHEPSRQTTTRLLRAQEVGMYVWLRLQDVLFKTLAAEIHGAAQVEVATMLFRDELEESGMEKEEMDAAVAEHRAQLLAEAEKELASRAAQDDAKADKRARCAQKCLNSHDRDQCSCLDPGLMPTGCKNTSSRLATGSGKVRLRVWTAV